MSSSVNKPKAIALSFDLNGKITLLTIVLLPLLVGLGFWQLERAAEKRQIQAQYDARQTQVAIEIGEENYKSLSPYAHVIARGSFDNEHAWLLDNQQRQGRPGFDVLQPFRFINGGTMLVNRGWLAGSEYRNDLPEFEKITGEVTLFAEVMEPSQHPMLNAESVSPTWPKIISGIELEVMAGQINHALASQYLRLNAASVGALDTQWHLVTISDAKHIGYAIQWFSMAIALIACFIFMNTNLAAWLKARFQ